MNCDEVQDRLSDYLERALEPAEAAAVEAHLRACRVCRAESEALARSIQGVAELAEIEPPANLVRNVMAQVRKESKKPTRWRWLFFPLHIKVPVQAMAVLLVSGLAVYLYMTAERSQVDILQDNAVARAPEMAMGANEEDRTVKTEDTRFAQAPAPEEMREGAVPVGKDAVPVRQVPTAEESRQETEITREREHTAAPKKPSASRVSVAEAPKPPKRATVPPTPEVGPEAPLDGIVRRDSPAGSEAAPKSDVATGTLEALIDVGRSHSAKSGPGAARSEETLQRELELLFAPRQGGATDPATRESLARLVEQLGGRLTAEDSEQPDTALSQETAPQVFWVSLPANRYDRFRTELSARGVITPTHAFAPFPTESSGTASWVRIKLTIQTP